MTGQVLRAQSHGHLLVTRLSLSMSQVTPSVLPTAVHLLPWLVTLTILLPTQPQEFIPGSCRVNQEPPHVVKGQWEMPASGTGGDMLRAAKRNPGAGSGWTDAATAPSLAPLSPHEPVHRLSWGFTDVGEVFLTGLPVMPGA